MSNSLACDCQFSIRHDNLSSYFIADLSMHHFSDSTAKPNLTTPCDEKAQSSIGCCQSVFCKFHFDYLTHLFLCCVHLLDVWIFMIFVKAYSKMPKIYVVFSKKQSGINPLKCVCWIVHSPRYVKKLIPSKIPKKKSYSKFWAKWVRNISTKAMWFKRF